MGCASEHDQVDARYTPDVVTNCAAPSQQPKTISLDQ